MLPGGAIVGTDPYTNQISVIELPETQRLILAKALDKARQNSDGAPESVQFRDETGADSFGQSAWVQGMNAGILYEFHQEAIFGPLNSLIPFTVILVVLTLAAMGLVVYIGTRAVPVRSRRWRASLDACEAIPQNAGVKQR
jgi:hypothetical protein